MAKKIKTVDVPEAGVVLAMAAVDPETGELRDSGAMEEAGVAFDPTRMHLDLTKDEKRRTTALVMAIQAYNNIIIKDSDYLREAHSQARANGSVIRPATMDAMVDAAMQFDAFIAGRAVPRSTTSRESQSGSPNADPSDQVPDKSAD